MYVNAGGNAIKILQRLLRDMGFDIAVDGAMGLKTAGAAHEAARRGPQFFADAYGIARRNYYFPIGIAARPVGNMCVPERAGKAGGSAGPKNSFRRDIIWIMRPFKNGWQHGTDDVSLFDDLWRRVCRGAARCVRSGHGWFEPLAASGHGVGDTRAVCLGDGGSCVVLERMQGIAAVPTVVENLKNLRNLNAETPGVADTVTEATLTLAAWRQEGHAA